MERIIIDGDRPEQAFPKLVEAYLRSVMEMSVELYVPRDMEFGTELLSYYDLCFDLIREGSQDFSILTHLDRESRRLRERIGREWFSYHIGRYIHGPKLPQLPC